MFPGSNTVYLPVVRTDTGIKVIFKMKREKKEKFCNRGIVKLELTASSGTWVSLSIKEYKKKLDNLEKRKSLEKVKY